MKWKFLLIFAVPTLATIGWQAWRIDALKADNARNHSNATALLSEVEHYRTSDSLNAVKSAVLALKLAEVEQYRAEDIKTIETLKIKRKELEQITAMQTRTITELRGRARDSVIMRESVEVVKVQCVDVTDAWIDLHGCIDPDGDFNGTLEVRDSLLVVETIKRKRFLGFLWRTKAIKSHKVDVVSKNPHTEIVGVESIQIER